MKEFRKLKQTIPGVAKNAAVLLFYLGSRVAVDSDIHSLGQLLIDMNYVDTANKLLLARSHLYCCT